MKKRIISLVAALLYFGVLAVQAQKQMTRTGNVSFYSATPLENIEAFNNEAAAVLNPSTGEVLFIVPIKSFRFEKALMQEHFNENYMESDKFPKAEYKGKIEGPVQYGKEGTYKITTKGNLTIHGVTRSVSVPGTIVVKQGTTTLKTKFIVGLADYNIKVPSVTASKIAKQVEVTVNAILKP